ncbi:MAG: pentapeptide repeat-containing protein [Microthrixaceae bacterium]
MRRQLAACAVGVVAGALAGGGIVWATIPHSSTGVATACYATSGTSKGVLRVIDTQAGEACPSGQKQVSLQTPLCTGYPRGGIDWRGCDYHAANLKAQFLSAARLNGTNLALASLTEAKLYGADLSAANLNGADLSLADLRTSKLTGASLAGARLDGVSTPSVKRTRLSGVVGLTSAQLRSVRTSAGGAIAPGCPAQIGPDLRSIELDSLNLSGFDLHGANLSYSSAKATNFSSADLSAAGMALADLTGANFAGANLTCVSAGGFFNNANFTNANLTDARFSGGVLTGAIWSNTTCPDGTNSNSNGNTCSGHL